MVVLGVDVEMVENLEVLSLEMERERRGVYGALKGFFPTLKHSWELLSYGQERGQKGGPKRWEKCTQVFPLKIFP